MLCPLLALAILFQGPGIGRPPGSPSIASVLLSERIGWSITYLPVVEQSESIWIQSRMQNDSNSAIAMRFQVKLPEIHITELATGKSKVQRLSTDSVQSIEWRTQTRPRDRIHQFRIDLRKADLDFGTGKYQARLVWRKNDLIWEGRNSGTGQMFESAAMEFEIRKNPPPEEPDRSIVFAKIPAMLDPFSDIEKQSISLTNKSDATLFLPDPNLSNDTDVFQSVMALYRWNCQSGWGNLVGVSYDEKNYGAREFTNFREIKPGQSVEVALPVWLLDGDGHYRFAVDLYHNSSEGPQGSKRFFKREYSNGFHAGRKP